MQGVFSMAARPRGCHWQTCTRTASTMSRPTSRRHPTRRKITASDVFKACYTGTMASAAVVDATRKDTRRQELDAKIESTRDKLAVLMEHTTAHDLAYVVDESASRPDHPMRPDAAVSVLGEFCKMQGFEVEPQHTKIQIRQAIISSFSPKLFLWLTPRTCDRVAGLDQCEELMAQELYPTEKQNNYIGLPPSTVPMIDSLVDALLQLAYEPTMIDDIEWTPDRMSPDSARNAIKMLRSEGYPQYTSPTLDPEATAKARARLNEVNLNIMADWALPLRDKLVGKICFNLLVSTVPPGIENYDMLLLGFMRLGEHKLAEAVAESFLGNAHFKPSQATLLCLLHHYRLSGNIVGFHRLIRRFLGHDARGIGLEQKHIEQVNADPRLRAWAQHADVAVVGQYVVERPRLDAPHWDAILEGFIDFGMVREAANVFTACLGRPWALEMRSVDQLFHACIVAVDTIAAQTLVHGFLHHLGSTVEAVLSPDALDIRPVKKLRTLLSVALGIKPMATDAMHPTNPAPRPPVRRAPLATSVWLRELTYTIDKLEHDLSRVAEFLRGEVDETVKDPLWEAFWRLERIEMWQEKRVFRGDRNGWMRRLAQLMWLDQMVRCSEKAIRRTEEDLLKAMISTLPRWLDKEMRPENITEFAKVSAHVQLCRNIMRLEKQSRRLDYELKVALYEALPGLEEGAAAEAGHTAATLPIGDVLVMASEYISSLRPNGRDTTSSP
ncbi:hypothetical protein QBC39DRAFT_109130 [Podospora conica]|nr:hypothetical protein QBC39DRAFT_109130 [Schizothecium conicum]